jgi:methenyltetrahydromethanopterin cyclohydrolase
MASGPARALALKPKDIYAEIEYEDNADTTIVVLESDKLPPNDAIAYIASECGVKRSRVYAFVTPTNSVAGGVQISGRIVEMGIYKMRRLGLDPKKIAYGFGSAPIPNIHPDSTRAMGRTNDAIYYGGEAYYAVNFEDDEKLKEIVSRTPSCTASEYGKPFHDIFKAAEFDFYKIDPDFFAPAAVTVSNLKTGRTFTSGQINSKVLRETMGISTV